MIYELRQYRAVPGKESDLSARFTDHTFDLFAKHGISVVGFWSGKDDPTCFVYLCEFADESQRDRAWINFQNDPAWKGVKERSEAGGSLTESMTSQLLVPLTRRGVE